MSTPRLLLSILLILPACGATRVPQAAPELASDPAPQVLWVATRGDESVTALEAGSLSPLGSLSLGLGAHELACSPDGRLGVGSAYGGPGAAHQPADQRLAVWDLQARALLRTIDLLDNQRPNDLAFLPDSRRVLVTSEVKGALLIVDTTTGTIETTIKLGHSTGHMLAYAPYAPSPGGLGRVYVSHVMPGLVSAIDVASGTLLEEIPTALGAEGIAATADGARVWCLNNRSSSISVIDGQKLELLDTLECPGFPFRAKFSADGQRVLVACPGANAVLLFDAATNAELLRIDLGSLSAQASPQGVALSADGKSAFVACLGLNAVLRLDLEAGTVTHRYEAGSMLDPITLGN